MKNLNHLIALLFLVTIFVRCDDDSLIVENEIENPVINELIEMGFSQDDIVETEEHFVVQGDMLFPKQLEAYIEIKKSKNSLSGNGELVFQAYAGITYLDVKNEDNILVFVEDEFDDEWTEGINRAIQTWNQVPGVCINLVLQENQNSNTDVVISEQIISNSGTIAQAELPLAILSNPFQNLQIDVFEFDNFTPEQTHKILVHEFGHILGLKHTDDPYQENASWGTQLVPGTTSNDNNSVMNTFYDGNNWFRFSKDDYEAIYFEYGGISVTGLTANLNMSGPASGTGTLTASVNAVPNAIKYTWYVNGYAWGSTTTNTFIKTRYFYCRNSGDIQYDLQVLVDVSGSCRDLRGVTTFVNDVCEDRER